MKKMLLAVIVLAVAVFCAMQCSAMYVASFGVERHTHTVQVGETLWGISVGYMDSQDRYNDVRGVMCDIEKANGLTMAGSHHLQPGQKLVIPLYVKKDRPAKN